jgi:very-short-patch-repair endonuclease
MSHRQNHTMLKILCGWCGKTASKKKSAIDYQQRKYERAGGKGVRPAYCSRACGQQASGTLYAHNISDPKAIANSLRTREGPRYEKIKKYLKAQDIKFKLEYNLPGTRYIFDIALKYNGQRILIELDNNYHDYLGMPVKDRKRDRKAKYLGWEVLRVRHPADMYVFSVSLIKNIVKDLKEK